MGWRDVLEIHPAAELFPMMSADDLKVLGEDIKENGLLAPIVIWTSSDPNDKGLFLLDGRNRLDAAEGAGLLKIERGEILFPSHNGEHDRIRRVYREGGDPYALAFSFNAKRRHLTAEQKRETITKAINLFPKQSNRQIAKLVGVSHNTVISVREEMEGRGQLDHVETLTDSLGRNQPAHKSPEPPPPPDPDPDAVEMGYQDEDPAPPLKLPENVDLKYKQAERTARAAQSPPPPPPTDIEKVIEIARGVKRATSNQAVLTLCDWIIGMRAEFDRAVQAELKKAIEMALPAYQKELDEARAIIKARKGVMPRETYRLILSCLHPDKSASDERLRKAFEAFRPLEPVLVAEKESPMSAPLPRTWDDWAKNRKVRV